MHHYLYTVQGHLCSTSKKSTYYLQYFICILCIVFLNPLLILSFLIGSRMKGNAHPFSLWIRSLHFRCILVTDSRCSWLFMWRAIPSTWDFGICYCFHQHLIWMPILPHLDALNSPTIPEFCFLLLGPSKKRCPGNKKLANQWVPHRISSTGWVNGMVLPFLVVVSNMLVFYDSHP